MFKVGHTPCSKTTIHVLQVLASCGLRYQAFHTRPQSAAVQSQQTPNSGEHVVGIGPFLFTFSQQRSERDLRIGCIHFWPVRVLLLFITASTAAHPQLGFTPQRSVLVVTVVRFPQSHKHFPQRTPFFVRPRTTKDGEISKFAANKFRSD